MRDTSKLVVRKSGYTDNVIPQADPLRIHRGVLSKEEKECDCHHDLKVNHGFTAEPLTLKGVL